MSAHEKSFRVVDKFCPKIMYLLYFTNEKVFGIEFGYIYEMTDRAVSKVLTPKIKSFL